MVEGELNPHADWINLMADIKHANKDKDNAFFKSRYATLENVLDRINEVSKPHRFSFYHNHLYDAETNTQYLVLQAIHITGPFMAPSSIKLHEDRIEEKGKSYGQAWGSINTYLRRIMLSTLFGIGADEDLDGNDSSQVNNNNDGVTKEKKPSSSNYPKKELNPQPSSAPQPPSPGKPNFRDKL
jgi:hypothetical protein|tara:strand:- start:729 stop:1280 length:552 start_codon:yes stop_codon:yes gene_type:complete